MYSIDITPDYPIFNDILSYTSTFDNIKCFNTDGVKYDPLHANEENKYIVSKTITMYGILSIFVISSFLAL